MSTQILINYAEVRSKTTELRQRIRQEQREADTTYRQAQSILRNLDGKTNSEFVQTVVANQQKAQVTAETLSQLLLFIDNSAREMERNEQLQARIFASSRAARIRINRGRIR